MASATLLVRARVRGVWMSRVVRWTVGPVVGLVSERAELRLYRWALGRIRAEVKVGSQPWQEVPVVVDEG